MNALYNMQFAHPKQNQLLMHVRIAQTPLCFLVFMLSTFWGGGNAVAQTVIPQSGWSLHHVDSEEVVGENGAAVNAFDGDGGTHWVTQWSGGPAPPYPHDLQIDLGALYEIEGVRYLPRDPSGGANGRIGQYELYVATDSATPPTIPLVLGEWTLVASNTFPNSAVEQEVLFSAATSRYVWLRALSEAQGTGNPWAAVGEFNVLGTLSSGLGIAPAIVAVTVGGQ
ncbi:MAG: hypothetical protein NPIRA04_25640 [Nitrospirales bacterium]|nr:MAG: hypothetical protein NPIRA04_25640 [Nitrospirales bacterium]